MKKTTHPNFILGIATLIILFAGVAFTGYGYRAGYFILLTGVALGAVHWIWAIIDVFRYQNLASQSRVFWLILIFIPMVGSLLYYPMSKTMRM